jgi:hypothetical protein
LFGRLQFTTFVFTSKELIWAHTFKIQHSSFKINTLGILEVDHSTYQITILSNIFLYGGAMTEEVRLNMEEEINTMWNAPRALLWYGGMPYLVNFNIQVFLFPNLQPRDIMANTNPRNNYIRVEETARGNISYVDGMGSNTGYFKLDNLYKHSTTAAHEYGHMIGLPHPEDLDIRGKGIPGIMYPRGTLVDPQFQYNAEAKAGEPGGTIHPINRRVLQKDVDNLRLAFFLKNNVEIIGKPSSVYHEVEVPARSVS